MKKCISHIALSLCLLILVSHTLLAKPVSATEMTQELTTEEYTQESPSVTLPTHEEFATMEPQEFVPTIVHYVYAENAMERPVPLDTIESLIGSASEVIDSPGLVNHHIYHLDKIDAYTIELKLAVTKDTNDVLEALAVLEYPTEDKTHTLKHGTRHTIKSAGEILQYNYQNKVHSRYEDIAPLFGDPYKISYIFDIEIFHHLGEDEYEDITISRSGTQLLALNYLNKNPERLNEPIEADKQELDIISHTSGYSWQQMVSKFGQPMGINYNSEQGIITFSWYSDAPDSIQEIYYYMGYDEIAIGTTYN